MEVSDSIIDGILKIAGMLGDPVLIFLFIVLCYFMLLIRWEKQEKKALVESTIDVLADQIDVLADEIKTIGEAVMQLTVLFKTLSLLRGKGVDDGKKYEKTPKPSDHRKNGYVETQSQ